MVGDNEPIAPGEFKEIEATGVDLSKAIIPLPYKEPLLNSIPDAQFRSSSRTKVC